MKKIVFGLLGILLLVSCEEVNPDQEQKEPESLFDRLRNDGSISGAFTPFTLIDHPQYQPLDSAIHLQDEDLVLIVKKEGKVYVYPHKYMYVEVVNDFIDGHPIAITFCPLTRSGLGWDRVVASDTALLTASGYLFLENLMPLDTLNGTLFSQMLSEGISGNRAGYKMNHISLVETKWATVEQFFPDARVFDPEETLIVCGAPGNHTSQSTQATVLKTAPLEDPHFFGIPGKRGVVLYSYDQFPGEIHSTFAMDIFGTKQILYMVGSETHGYIVAFNTSYTMTPLSERFPVILEDETGTQWDIFGEAVSGPRMGEKLESPDHYVALDWAWELLFENVKYFVPNSL